MRLNLIILIFTVILSGCSVLEYIWLVPRASGEVNFNPKYSNKEILDMFVQIAKPKLKFFNQPSETYRNVYESIVEIGHHNMAGLIKSSVAGFTAHAEIDREDHVLSFVVKGAGGYYQSLPVDDVVQKITYELSQKVK